MNLLYPRVPRHPALSNLSDMATRRDLGETGLWPFKETEQVRADPTEKIEQSRAGLKIDISQVQLTWLNWGLLFWAAQFGTIVLLIRRIWPKG